MEVRLNPSSWPLSPWEATDLMTDPLFDSITLSSSNSKLQGNGLKGTRRQGEMTGKEVRTRVLR